MTKLELLALMASAKGEAEDGSEFLDWAEEKGHDIDDVLDAIGTETLVRYGKEYDSATSHYNEDTCADIWDELRWATRDEMFDALA